MKEFIVVVFIKVKPSIQCFFPAHSFACLLVLVVESKELEQ